MNQLRDKSVLIIDDDAAMLRALERVLAGEGGKVTCATSVEDAVAILGDQKIPVDVVITDLMMPGISGLMGLYGIRNLFPTLPVIVLTACTASDLRAECLSHGVAAFLEKPLDAPNLVGIVEAVCRGGTCDYRQEKIPSKVA
jgi:DNA-binding response OmpR family regulator